MSQNYHQQHDPNIRFAAQSLYDNLGPMQQNRGGYQQIDMMNRSQSINLISEDFISGFVDNGRMSIVRRFFCLFVTFDLIFITLLWLICILITGDNIYHALKIQILQYSIYTSVFDIVMAALCRFVILLLFYALLYINHWIVIAFSTTASCVFLISKVFVYDWVPNNQPVFHVLLIIVSFVLAWGEAWFFDCRVIPQERFARSYFTTIINSNYQTERTPLLAPLLVTETAPTQPESVFYSPYDTTHNSDEEDAEDEEFRLMGNECVRKAYEILQSGDWKIEKVTQKGDNIQSKQYETIGKIYRLTARLKYPAKTLLEELFYKIEEIPKWNPTLLESKIVRKIDTHTDITYQATVGGGGGLVKPRDFVNLRCWRLCRDGEVIIDSEDDNDDDEDDPTDSYQPSTTEGSVTTLSDDDNRQDLMNNCNNNLQIPSSSSTTTIQETEQLIKGRAFQSLSKSLGARDFSINNEHLESSSSVDNNIEFRNDDDSITTNVTNTTTATTTTAAAAAATTSASANKTNLNSELYSEKFTEKIYISSALSIIYPAIPVNSKYTRGQNLVSCWAMREIEGKPDVCIFEWLLCLDLKGFIPRYVLDATYTSFMQEYMVYLRKYCKELRQKRKRVPTRRNLLNK